MSHLHVLPVGDLVQHDCVPNDECACGPTPHPIGRDDGSVGWLIVHHALDGRS